LGNAKVFYRNFKLFSGFNFENSGKIGFWSWRLDRRDLMSLDEMCIGPWRTISIPLIFAVSIVFSELWANLFLEKIGSPGKGRRAARFTWLYYRLHCGLQTTFFRCGNGGWNSARGFPKNLFNLGGWGTPGGENFEK
jgi:hypothetical protein